MKKKAAGKRRTPNKETTSVYWGILHRAIFLDLLRVFAMALLALTGLLLLGGILAEASQRGLPPGQLLSVIPLIIPSTLPYTLPTTTLFATCIVYGRLAHDNEILAVKSSGVHLIHVIWPGLLLGATVSAVTVGLYYDLIPRTHHELRVRVLRDVEEYLYSMLKREGKLRHPKLNYEIHVRLVQGRKLLDAVFMRRDPTGLRFDLIARAQEAELLVDLAHNKIYVQMKHCHVANDSGEYEGFVENQNWPVELPEDLTNFKKTSARSMTWLELWHEADETERKKRKFQTDLAAHQAVLNTGKAPANYPIHVETQRNEIKHSDAHLSQLHTEMHSRPALALGCFCFVLVGCPVGIWFSRSDFLSAFITCFLPIVSIYYPLLLAGTNLSKMGRIHPGLGLWIPNVLMALIAAFLFRRLLKN
ncbi:MAG: LptF/LptG family permease [Gemmataceae bacterium]|nr:LptF/LptG family permease [Gemmataceae bacterium]